MSKLDLVQLGSLPFKPRAMFSAFQAFGNTTTLEAYPTNMTVPVAVPYSSGHNAVGLLDNTHQRVTTAVFAFACTAANNVKMALDVTGFTKCDNGLYLRTQFFLGETQAGNYDISTATGEATAFACDNFSLKTTATSSVSYVEPTADSSFALLLVDIRGFDYAMVRIAQGAATAATKGQVWVGVN
jgi:hypothetical protein